MNFYSHNKPTKDMKTKTFTLLLMLLVAGVTTTAQTGERTTQAIKSNERTIRVTENVAYRTDVGPSTVLDIATPQFGPQTNRPAILIIHGGGWSAGSKNDHVYRSLMVDYALKGYVVCNMNYRLVQEAPLPACIEDVRCAIRWMKANAATLGIDPQRIGTYGHSAGGHLSLMAGVAAGSKAFNDGGDPWRQYDCSVACAAGGAPPTEIGRAGEWADHKEWWPIGYIGKSATPFLVLQGGEDPIVKPALTEDWVVKMQRAGSQVDYVKVHGQHGVAFDQQLEFTRPAMDAFYARYLKHNDPTVSFEQMKVADYGGSGPYKAVALRERSLTEFVVYRPMNLGAAVGRERAKLPVLVFCNGGCMDTSIGYENMLTDVASYGYMVVAIGELQMLAQHDKDQHTPSSMVQQALDWISQQAANPSSPYYNYIDGDRIAAAGHSCGGAQVLANCGDQRLKTYIILNAGMGRMTMADASAKSLKQLHGPILYLVGGTSDVAWPNAQQDYKTIRRVPVWLADNTTSGHGGTYEQPAGGANSRMVRAWLDWQLKGKAEPEKLFVDGNLTGYDGFTIEHKNYKAPQKSQQPPTSQSPQSPQRPQRPQSSQQPQPSQQPLWLTNGSRKIYGELFTSPKSKPSIAIIAHGFNGTHEYGRNYYETLGRLGYDCYTLDFPCGSVRSKSDPNTLNMSILDEVSDLKAVVKHFRDKGYKRIVLIGESQGGLVSALTAADLKDQVSQLVLVYPALCIPDNWRERYPRREDIKDVTELWGVKMGRRFFEEIHDMRPLDIVGQYRGPVLIVQGDEDQVVSMDDSRRAQQLYAAGARLHVIPGARHGFNPQELRQEMEQLEKFLYTVK